MALNHQEPDRVPIDINYSLHAYMALRKYFGLSNYNPSPDHWGRVWERSDLVDALGTDCLNIGLGIPISGRNFKWGRDKYVDDYGIVWKKIEHIGGFYYEVVEYPIKEPNVDEFNKIDWINPNESIIFDGAYEMVENAFKTTGKAIIMLLATHIWERAIQMCGNENWWIYLITRPDFCIALLEKLADIQRKIYMNGLDLVGKYITILRLGGEDFGTQRGLFISKNMFHAIVKPILKSVYKPIKERYLNLNPQGKILFHSDGSIRDLIPDFIDLGIDVLDPVQPRAVGMNGFELKRDFGNQISFHGGIDTQGVLPWGTIENVELEVRRKIEMFAPGGGYILSPSHTVQSDVPVENIMHLTRTAKRYGVYPINRHFSDFELMEGRMEDGGV
jgi:uroporphyrinogen decarboxylase